MLARIVFVVGLFVASGCSSPKVEHTLDPNTSIDALESDVERDLCDAYAEFQELLITRARQCHWSVGGPLVSFWAGGALGPSSNTCQEQIDQCRRQVGVIPTVTCDRTTDSCAGGYRGCEATVGEVVACWEAEVEAIARWSDAFNCQLVAPEERWEVEACTALRDRCFRNVACIPPRP